MQAINRDAIAATERMIRPHVRHTPVITIDGADFGLEKRPLAFKLEFLQHTGSFKPRGAFANLLTRQAPEVGVVAASGGNHGAAVAFAAMLLVQSVAYQYFSLWADNPKSRLAFYPELTELALQIDRLPDDIPKYVVTARAGVPGDLHWLVQPIGLRYGARPRPELSTQFTCKRVKVPGSGQRARTTRR